MPSSISSQPFFELDNPRMELIESRRKSAPPDNRNCRVLRVLLTDKDLKAERFDEGVLPGARQGGTVTLSDPEDPSRKIGDYTFLITFLPDSNCVAIGGYTFYDSQDEITFTATCKSLPFFTITGGKGKYMDAVGFIQFMIEVDDGFIHEINLCRRSESSKP